jgi:hypothetical protein
MSTYDVTPDDEPLDMRAVTADDQLVEKLRHALSPEAAVVWDDDEDDMDPGYALLRALQLDVSADLPTEVILPAEVTELLPRRRHLSRTATIAVVAASVLSVGGVAAASAPGQPLAGVREAVSTAVADAVDAITPDKPVGPAAVPTASPSPKPTPPGAAVSDAARSAAAILQIEDNLARAEAMLDDGRLMPAKAQLDAAERKLNYVLVGADRDRLSSRLLALQARLATATPRATPSTGKPDDKGKPQESRKPDDKGKDSGPSVDRSGEGGAATPRPSVLPSRNARSSNGDAKMSDAARQAVDEASERRRGNN